MAEKSKTEEKKVFEELLFAISYDEVVRIQNDPEADYMAGRRLDTGEEVNVRLFDADEIKELGMKPINKNASFQRPTIRQIITKPDTAPTKFTGIVETLKELGVDPSAKKLPTELTFRIDSVSPVGDPDSNFLGTRWITNANGKVGKGPMDMAKDFFSAYTADNAENGGRLITLTEAFKVGSRPLAFVKAGMFDLTNIDDSDNGLFGADGIERAMGVAIEEAKKMSGTMPAVMISVIGADGNPVQGKAKTVTKAGKEYINDVQEWEIKNYVQDSNGKKTWGKNSRDMIENYLSSEQGLELSAILEANEGASIVSVPIITKFVGKDTASGILDKMSDKFRKFFYKPFIKEAEGMRRPQQAYTEAFLSERHGDTDGKSFVTGIFSRRPTVIGKTMPEIAAEKVAERRSVNVVSSAPKAGM